MPSRASCKSQGEHRTGAEQQRNLSSCALHIAKLALATITHDLVSLVGPKQPQMLDFAHQIWSRHKFPTCLSLQTPTMVLKSARSRRVNSFPPPFSTKHGSSAERQRSCTAPAARSQLCLSRRAWASCALAYHRPS